MLQSRTRLGHGVVAELKRKASPIAPDPVRCRARHPQRRPRKRPGGDPAGWAGCLRPVGGRPPKRLNANLKGALLYWGRSPHKTFRPMGAAPRNLRHRVVCEKASCS